MSKLSEEKENAIRMIAFNQWLAKFEKEHSRRPNTKEVWEFIQVLNDRTPPATPEGLINLIEKEKKVRSIADKIAHNEMIPRESFIVNLKPSPNYTMIVRGGCPSIIELGITPGEPDFMTLLRKAIRKAYKLYHPSALIAIPKILEYQKEIKKFKVWEENEDYYPVLPEDRLQVRVYEQIRVIDMKTGEVAVRTKETEQGMYRHLKNNYLAQQARLDLSRKLYAEGKITKEDFDYEREEPTRDKGEG